ncbi:hypothetical protein ACP70R_047241 [Stipagrostis hirtigluma subsp. patula]
MSNTHAGSTQAATANVAIGAAKTDAEPPVGTMARTLTSSANLLQLLPTGAVLAFQTLAATFTNQGQCLTANWWLTLGLVTFLTATCIFFAFTDTVIYDDKVYHGVALPRALHLFNLPKNEQRKIWPELRKLRLKPVDSVHAFFTAVVFLTIAGSDVGLQKCFFKNATADTQQLLRNLPLGMAVLSSFVFMIFPSTRKGMGFTDSDYNLLPDKAAENDAKPAADNAELETAAQKAKAEKTADEKVEAAKEADAKKTAAKDGPTKMTNLLKDGPTKMTNLLQLLPSGAVLAFQTLAVTFTNQGNCLPSNWWLTLGLVTFLTATCIFFAFTDSVVYNDKVYHGVALPKRLYVFNLPRTEQKLISVDKLREKRLKPVDWVHAFFTAVVFLTIAGSDVGLQDCFFKNASQDAKQLLRNLPLGMAVLSSFVFMIFPANRRGFGFNDSKYSVIHPITSQKPGDSNKPDPENPQTSMTSASASLTRSTSKVTPESI